MSIRLQNIYACQRRAWRLRVDRDDESFAEFDFPKGWCWTLNLVEISDGGVGFRLEGGRPTIEIGTVIAGAAIQIGKVRIEGALRIMHVTPDPEDGTICGAAFTPASPADERTMSQLLDALEKQAPR
jgi:c-di-GMP-binding flagellar brake protein YcgR